MQTLTSCLIGLGSNLGNRRQSLQQAAERIDRHPQMRLIAKSSWHETAPIGGPKGQPRFLNGAVVLQTSLRPQDLLGVLQQIETDLGRQRGRRWGPRTVDLDLLLHGLTVLNTPSLVLPHPRMAWRRFVLRPAAEVAGTMVHPPTGWTITQLLNHLDASAPYLAITGSIGAGKTHLAKRLARVMSARLLSEQLDLQRLSVFYADPASHAWDMELEFLQQRAELLGSGLLADGSPIWSERRLVVSDFWFDQSAAFARVWLPEDQQEAFGRRFAAVRERVVRPRLIVLLEVPSDQLMQRVLRRGRACERGLSEGQLEQIHQSILSEATRAGQGPLLRLPHGDWQQLFPEVLAAAEAMQ